MGWITVAVLSPIILVIAFLCALASGSASHNVSAAELCFYGGELPADTPEEYRTYIEDMRTSFELLDSFISSANEKTEEEKSLDEIRVKAFFYALYFGEDSPSLGPEERASADLTGICQASRRDHQKFVDCFVTYEKRTRMVPIESSDPPVEAEETYTVAVPIEDLETVWRNIATAMDTEPTAEQKANADSVYSLIRYGYTGGGTADGGGFAGADVPYIGADGFCSPIGPNWRNIITSEFGYRRDPFTGKTKGHGGMDLAVPTGTPIRAALPGTVTVSTYNQGGYGYYVMIDHGGGLATLYGHCSQLIARVGRTVQAGDVIALSGSTGRSTGPHLHFEVRVNGERTNPRSYLP